MGWIYRAIVASAVLMSGLPHCRSDEFRHLSSSIEAVDVQFVQQSDVCSVASLYTPTKIQIAPYPSPVSNKHDFYSILDEDGNALRLLELSHLRTFHDSIWGVVTVQQTAERVDRLLFRIGGGRIKTEPLGVSGNSPEFRVVGLSEGVDSVEICLARRIERNVISLGDVNQECECQFRRYFYGFGGVFTEAVNDRRELKVNSLMFPTSRGLVTEEKSSISRTSFQLLSSQSMLGQPINLSTGAIGTSFYGLIDSGRVVVCEILNARGERLLFRDDLTDVSPPSLVLNRGRIHGETRYALGSKGDLFFATRYARSIELGKISTGTGKSSEISVLRPAIGLEFQSVDVVIDSTGCFFVLTTEGPPVIID